MTKTQGSTLIEVVVSLFLLSIIIIGVAAMQLKAINTSKSDYYFSAANAQIRNYIEINKLTETDASVLIVEWVQETKAMLPQSEVTIDARQVIIAWGGYKENRCNKTKIGNSGCLVYTAMKD